MIGNNKMIGVLLSLAVLAMLALPVYAADDATTGNMTGNASMNKTVTVNLSAKDVAFNMSTITVPAGANVTISFDNQDSGIPHNFAVYTDSSAATTIYKGPIITGPKKTNYTFMAPSKPGTYFFRCDVHPTQMTGQFIVE